MNTDLFARKVMPGLRDVFADHDDPWWPAGCPRT
jgi:hypothetical protein